MKYIVIIIATLNLFSCSQEFVEGDPNHKTSQNDTVVKDARVIGEPNLSQKPQHIDTTILNFEAFSVQVYDHDCSVISLALNSDTIFLEESVGGMFDRATFRILPKDPLDKFFISAAFSKRLLIYTNDDKSALLKDYSLPIIFKILGAKSGLYKVPAYNYGAIETELNLDLERVKNIIKTMDNINLATPLIETSTINQLPVEPVIDRTVIKIERTLPDGTFEIKHIVNKSSIGC